MDYILNGCREAVRIIGALDPEFLHTVFVSLKLAAASVLLAALAGIPVGIWLALGRFRFRNILITISNTLMSLPTVVVGLLVYSFLTRRGPLGELNLLFTQTAIIIGQFILIIPIVVSLTVSAVSSLDRRAHKTALSLGADRKQAFRLVVSEARFGILAGLVSAFGRVFAEVGISMMLGGNIRHYTRTITTAIALETSKGDFALGIALGFVLLLVAFAINISLARVRRFRKDEAL
jgi:tungstate transport system permease protein